MSIIEKEKARQEELSKLKKETYDVAVVVAIESQHKQSLINLKEYMEEMLDSESDTRIYDYEQIHDAFLDQLKHEIKELTKLIEAYND